MNSSDELLDRLYSLLPRLYRNMDAENRGHLKKYLQIITEGGLYPIYEETKNILNLKDIDRIPAKYLPYLASTLGFPFPHDLDEITQRTYIKNAVSSYKIKGTKQALAFMIRELTRFKTTVETDDTNKILNILLEVDMSRPNFAELVKKVDFIVQEYSPPYKEYNLVDSYIYEEDPYILLPTEFEMSPTPAISFVIEDEIPTIQRVELELNSTISSLEDEIASIITVIDEISYTLSVIDDELANTYLKTEEELAITVTTAITSDLTYEQTQWFFSNISLTNQQVTVSDEFYDIIKITDDYTEVITTA